MELVNLALALFAAALVAQLMTPGLRALGILATCALGAAGATFATLFARAFGWYGGGEIAGFGGALVGSLAVLAIYRMFDSTPPRQLAGHAHAFRKGRPRRSAANDERVEGARSNQSSQASTP